MEEKQKKILIVASQSPYPTYHGGAFDVFEKLKGIKEIGLSIDLVITTKNKIDLDSQDFIKKYVDDLFIVERKNRLLDLFLREPIQYTSRTKLKNINFDKSYDYVLLESEFLSSILLNKTLKYNELIFRVHNNESYYFRQLAKSTNNFFKKIYYLSDSLKTRRITYKLLDRADKIWYISNKEFEESQYKRKAIFLPPPINDHFIKNESQNKTVLFIGSLFMTNNIQGLDWFLEKIHPELITLYEDYKLIIAGSTGDIDEERIKNKYKGLAKVEIYLNQKSLNDFYTQSSIFINPMFFGSGVKLKSINAIVKGMLLLSTDVGAEGIGLSNEMYLKANNEEEFLLAIKKSFDMEINVKQNIIDKAQDYLKSIHYMKILKQELYE